VYKPVHHICVTKATRQRNAKTSISRGCSKLQTELSKDSIEYRYWRNKDGLNAKRLARSYSRWQRGELRFEVLQVRAAATRGSEFGWADLEFRKSAGLIQSKVQILVLLGFYFSFFRKTLKIQILDSRKLLPLSLVSCVYSYAIVCTWL